MNLIINGQAEELDGIHNIEDIIVKKNLQKNTFAISLNNQFVARHHYAVTLVKELDQIEILIAMQGG